MLVFIEKEGMASYKNLKLEFNVATGTLYHHLKLLKGFLTQNEFKQYEITGEGKKALDFLFREKKDEFSSVSNEISPKITDIPIEKKNFIVRTYHDLFSLPLFFYNAVIGLLLVLSTIIAMLQPKITFFHFVPLFVTENWAGIIPLIWMGISVTLFSLIYFFQKIRPDLTTYGLFFLYFDFYLLSIILINLFPIFQFQELYQVVSLVFQGLYIVTWVFLLSYNCWTWEKSLVTALLQNYGFLVIFF